MKLLWVSRHYMTEDQLNSLNTIFEKPEIIQYDKTVEDISDIVSDDIDVYAVVFPVNKLSELYFAVKGRARIIVPESERKFTGDFIVNPSTGLKEKEYAFCHRHWIEYKKIEIETEVLD